MDTIVSSTQLYVRDSNAIGTNRFNCSAYLIADSATLTQPPQTDFINSLVYDSVDVILTDIRDTMGIAQVRKPITVIQGGQGVQTSPWWVDITDGTNSLHINPDGSINANIVSTSADLTLWYNETTAVPSNTETTIFTLTAPSAGYKVKEVQVSGDTVATFKLKINGSTNYLKRTWWGNFNQIFDFAGDDILLTSGQVLTITVLHTRPTVGTFEVTAMTL